MARKRVVKKKAKAPVETAPKQIAPLMEAEGKFFQELVDSSNQLTNARKQESQYVFILEKLKGDRKKIQDGDIKLPMIMTLIPKLLSYNENDKKKILKIFDDQIKAYSANITTIKGQIALRYENYIESAVRNREFLNIRFKSAKVKHIVPLRDIGEKDEELLFEAEFSKLTKDKDLQKEFHKAEKKAISKNIARKKKA